MRFDEIPETIEAVGNELGWDADKRADKRADFERRARAHLKRGGRVVFLPFQRHLSAAEQLGTDPASAARGATLRDAQGGAEYDVVVDERGRPTYYAVRAIDGALSGIDEWPRDVVTLLVRQYLRDEVSEPMPREQARRSLAGKGGQPRHEYVAGLIREAHAAGVSPRTVVAAQTGRSLPTVDRWLREARAADPTLPQATRHPHKRTKGTDQ